MGGNKEILPSKRHPEENNGGIVHKNADIYISKTQERIGEAVKVEKYKEQTIDYWLNEIFWLPERKKDQLKTKVDFNKKISIKELREFELENNLDLGTTTLIVLADESLNQRYMDAFADYLDGKDIRMSTRVSIESFLELLSGFEEERPQTINDRALERLKFDESERLRIYCQNTEKNYNRDETIMTRKGFEELLKLKEAHDLEEE